MKRQIFTISGLISFIMMFSSILFAQSEKEIITQLKSEISNEEKIQLLGELPAVSKTGSKGASKILTKYLSDEAEGSVRGATALAMGKIRVGRIALKKLSKLKINL